MWKWGDSILANLTLYFQNSQGKRRPLATNLTEKDAFKLIHEFCEQRNFKIYYTRHWTENGETWYDVGSHTEFFITVESDEPLRY